MKTRTIRQTITLDASPHDVYEMLMDEKKHARFTAGAAEISRDVGGAFFTNSGYFNRHKQGACSGHKDCPDLAGERLA